MSVAFSSQPLAAEQSPIFLGVPSKHPRGFNAVWVAVLCERTAAYLLASLLVLMLCERYGYPRDEALRMAGLVTAAGYLGCLPGGLLADRLLGHRRGLSFSLIFLTVGYLLLTLPSRLALWPSVAVLILGNSLFKPSAHAVLGRLYAPNDPRLERAQVWLHLAINVGAVLGAVIAGLTTEWWGWSGAFAVAALAVFAGWLCLFIGHRDGPAATRPALSSERNASAEDISPWNRVKTIAALTLAMLLLNVCFGQVEGSLLLWATQHTDRTLVGYTMPPSWFVGIPGLLVLILAPVQLGLLPRLQRRLGIRRLVAVGLVATSLAFLVLLPAVVLSNRQLVSVGWLVICHSLLVIGETLVGPLGLAQVLRLAPPRFMGAVMGVWFVFGAVGYWLAGEIGALWVRWSPIGGLVILTVLPLLGAGMLFVAERKGSAEQIRASGST